MTPCALTAACDASDNRDSKPHHVSFTIQAINFDGHVLESVSFHAKLDKKESKTVAEEIMIRIENLPFIKSWDVSKIKVN
jgi:hypothetical protein